MEETGKFAPDLLSVAMRYASPEVCEYLINIGCVSTAPELVGMLARRSRHSTPKTPLEADQLSSRLVTMVLDVGYDPSELLVCLVNEIDDLERRESEEAQRRARDPCRYTRDPQPLANDPFSEEKWIRRLHSAPFKWLVSTRGPQTYAWTHVNLC